MSALQFQGRRTEGLHALTGDEWTDLLSRWDFHRCMVPLRLTCGDELPQWVRLQIDQQLEDNAERLEQIKWDYGRFSNALRSIEASHVVIKGFTLWPGFVDHPRFRLQSDIDVYCPPESILRARDALVELGYEPETQLNFKFADHLPTMVPRTNWKWRGNFYDPEMPASFELHRSFWNEKVMRLRLKGLDQFWMRRTEREFDGIRFPALCEVDTFGYAALHLTRNLLRENPSLHQIYELARFLNVYADNQHFWEDWRRLHEDSLRRLEAIACHTANRCFACEVPDEISQEIASLPDAATAWFDQFTRLPMTADLHPRRDWVWLHVSLVGSPREKLAIVRNRLLPSQVTMRESVDLMDRGRGRPEAPRSPIQRQSRYAAYVAWRLGYYARLFPSELWRGVRFWWSTKGLSRPFWNFFAISFLFDLGLFIFFFLYNLYLLDRGFRENFIGLVASANTIGGVVSCIPSGILAQRAGLRKTLILCMTSVALIAGALSLVSARQTILVLSFFLGSASTIWAVAIAPATARLTNEKNRQIGFSLIFSSGIAVGLLGSMSASRVPGLLMHMYQSMTAIHAKQATLLLGCAIVAVGAWPALRLQFIPVPDPEKRFYPRNPFLFRFLLVVAVWTLGAGAFVPFYNVYFSQYLHLGLERIGMVNSLSQISQALAILAAPIVLKKYGVIAGIVYMQLATALALGCLATVHAVPAAVVLYTAYTALQWMSEPAIYSLLMSRVAPSEQAGASAINFLVISLAQSIATALAGASFVRFGYPAVLGVTAAVTLASAGMFRSVLGRRNETVPAAVTDSLSLR
jgi:predicted MFS family arabinose efflux permease